MIRDLNAGVVTLRAKFTLERATNRGSAVPGGATSAGAPTGIMTPTPEAGTELGGTPYVGLGAALAAMNVGLVNSPGLEIGVEAVVLNS